MSKAQLPPVFIGTSGWSYRSWRGPFFPAALPAHRHLDYYAHRFCSTELNGVFYRTPTPKAVRAWAAQTPDGFVFAWKASKYITHWKRLRPDMGNSLTLLESRIRLLKSKAGPVLFQLPPQFRKDAARLASFLKRLPKPRPYVFEFRHPSWYTPEILDLLRDHRSALCISDHQDAPAPWEITAPHVYVRGHGPLGNYQGRYAPQTLGAWARRLSHLRDKGHAIYVYFDNDQKSAAPLDAERMLRLMTRNRTDRKASSGEKQKRSRD